MFRICCRNIYFDRDYSYHASILPTDIIKKLKLTIGDETLELEKTAPCFTDIFKLAMESGQLDENDKLYIMSSSNRVIYKNTFVSKRSVILLPHHGIKALYFAHYISSIAISPIVSSIVICHMCHVEESVSEFLRLISSVFPRSGVSSSAAFAAVGVA